jgi:hypothetical protein
MTSPATWQYVASSKYFIMENTQAESCNIKRLIVLWFLSPCQDVRTQWKAVFVTRSKCQKIQFQEFIGSEPGIIWSSINFSVYLSGQATASNKPCKHRSYTQVLADSYFLGNRNYYREVVLLVVVLHTREAVLLVEALHTREAVLLVVVLHTREVVLLGSRNSYYKIMANS